MYMFNSMQIHIWNNELQLIVSDIMLPVTSDTFDEKAKYDELMKLSWMKLREKAYPAPGPVKHRQPRTCLALMCPECHSPKGGENHQPIY